jgi:hypothetical protein
MAHYSLATFHIDDDALRAKARTLLISSGVPDTDIGGFKQTLMIYIETDEARTLLLDKVAMQGLFANEILVIDIDQSGLACVEVSTDEGMIPSPF